jgi:hypothetical protein
VLLIFGQLGSSFYLSFLVDIPSLMLLMTLLLSVNFLCYVVSQAALTLCKKLHVSEQHPKQDWKELCKKCVAIEKSLHFDQHIKTGLFDLYNRLRSAWKMSCSKPFETLKISNLETQEKR